MRKVIKIPLWRNYGGGRNIVVPKEGFRSLQRQVQDIKEEIGRGFDPRKGDGIEDDFEKE